MNNVKLSRGKVAIILMNNMTRTISASSITSCLSAWVNEENIWNTFSKFIIYTAERHKDCTSVRVNRDDESSRTWCKMPQVCQMTQIIMVGH